MSQRGLQGDALAEYLDHFRVRVIQDALNEATRSYWLRRAQDFEDAAPREDDHHGQASNTELTAAYHRATDTATACRHRASIAHLDDDTNLILCCLHDTEATA